jgi:Domain of unknown function (DUF222)
MDATPALELAELFAVDVSLLSLPERVEHQAAIERVRNKIDAVLLAHMADFEQSGAWQEDAASSAINWFQGQIGGARDVMASRVKLANHLLLMPGTREAFEEGAITESHAKVLSRCVANPRVRDRFAEDEAVLVALATEVNADQLATQVDQWIRLHDQDGAEPHDPEHDTVNANRVGDRVKVNADLGLETGIPLLEALNERNDQLWRRDRAVVEANPEDPLGSRTPGNRRAEALVGLVLDGAGAECNARRREPLFTVLMDYETFLSGTLHPGSVLETVDGSVIPIGVAERWLCDSRWELLVQGAAGEVLMLGREERYANRAVRRALAARDRGCAAPGCTAPVSQCDAHHVTWWEHDGLTNVDEMALLCRHHHRLVHAGMLEIMMVNGLPVFLDRYGNELTDGGRRRPPPEGVAA